jgi:hypothetical protein
MVDINNNKEAIARLKAKYEEMLVVLRQQRTELEQKIELVQRHLEAADYLNSSDLSELGDLDELVSLLPPASMAEEVQPLAERRGRRGIADAAYEVLGSKPYLHATDLWAELERRGHRSTSTDPVKVLGTMLLRDNRFTKVAPQTFARSPRRGK